MVKRATSSAAENKGLALSPGAPSESVGHPIAVDITGLGDGESEPSVLISGGIV